VYVEEEIAAPALGSPDLFAASCARRAEELVKLSRGPGARACSRRTGRSPPFGSGSGRHTRSATRATTRRGGWFGG
jgi:hypothetical protein